MVIYQISENIAERLIDNHLSAMQFNELVYIELLISGLWYTLICWLFFFSELKQVSFESEKNFPWVAFELGTLQIM